MKIVRTFIVIGSVVAAAVGSGDARADVPGQQQPPAAGQQQKEAATSETGDIVQTVDESLSGITLRPDVVQEFQTVAADVDAKVTAVEQAKRDVLFRLADAVEAGKVDEASLQPQTEQFVDAASKASPVVRKALEKLHDSLDPQQRKQFVANFHDALKKRVMAADPKQNLDDWATALKLTDDQKEKIGAIFAEDETANDVARDRARLVLDAFKGDDFSMDDLLPGASIGHRTRRMIHRVIDVAARITAILTPEQRTAAAAMLRDRAAGKSTGDSATAQTSSALEATAATSEALWAGSRTVYRSRYRSSTGWGFRRGFGWGGTFLF